MSNTFLISDTHFGHTGATQFMNDDGSKMRPWDTVEAMDEALVENWNRVVRPKDKVYHLGDVVINRKALKTLERLNGEKVLIKGNHDLFRLEEYTPYFKDIRGVGILGEYVLSHIPIHPASLSRWKANIHGHLHTYRVMDGGEIDPRYFSVCVEQRYVNYTPIPLESVKVLVEGQQWTS